MGAHVLQSDRPAPTQILVDWMLVDEVRIWGDRTQGQVSVDRCQAIRCDIGGEEATGRETANENGCS